MVWIKGPPTAILVTFDMEWRSRVYRRRIGLGLVPIVSLMALSTISESRRLTPLLTTVVLPQQALGDFDGDGRADVARIQHDVRGSSIAVHLSDSAATTEIKADVSALVERDIDHDGDLDLVAATPTGAVLIWINDGHGRFSPQNPWRTTRIVGETGLFQTLPTLSATFTTPHVALPRPQTRRRANVVVTRIRPPTVASVSNQTLGLLPPLRAPPSIHS